MKAQWLLVTGVLVLVLFLEVVMITLFFAYAFGYARFYQDRNELKWQNGTPCSQSEDCRAAMLRP